MITRVTLGVETLEQSSPSAPWVDTSGRAWKSPVRAAVAIATQYRIRAAEAHKEQDRIVYTETAMMAEAYAAAKRARRDGGALYETYIV